MPRVTDENSCDCQICEGAQAWQPTCLPVSQARGIVAGAERVHERHNAGAEQLLLRRRRAKYCIVSEALLSADDNLGDGGIGNVDADALMLHELPANQGAHCKRSSADQQRTHSRQSAGGGIEMQRTRTKSCRRTS
jgi:hypothetical protein